MSCSFAARPRVTASPSLSTGCSQKAALGRMGKRIVLVDRRTKAQRTLAIAGPSRICGFSPDGSRLLLVSSRDEAGRAKGDAYVVDLKSGARRRVVRDVIEAVWVQVPDTQEHGPTSSQIGVNGERTQMGHGERGGDAHRRSVQCWFTAFPPFSLTEKGGSDTRGLRAQRLDVAALIRSGSRALQRQRVIYHTTNEDTDLIRSRPAIRTGIGSG
jgi:hypothetical protein